ncbi:MAG: iron dependent repressor, metal binding and dimerization domain protein [Candidatus Thermoplasmatota archaeon]|nr:iron dependent repressor, metal binding and dimerization domain protein [Candidatus Thermoplasmatota archaeon]
MGMTYRDKEYIRVLFSLDGANRPVGPVQLAQIIGVSKECAYQKMRRLGYFGYGQYHHNKGFQLNKKAVHMVEEDAKRHHILEHFLQKTLHLPHHQACQEAMKMDASISLELYNRLLDQFTVPSSSCCGFDFSENITPKKIKQCPWFLQITSSKK